MEAAGGLPPTEDVDSLGCIVHGVFAMGHGVHYGGLPVLGFSYFPSAPRPGSVYESGRCGRHFDVPPTEQNLHGGARMHDLNWEVAPETRTRGLAAAALTLRSTETTGLCNF